MRRKVCPLLPHKSVLMPPQPPRRWWAPLQRRFAVSAQFLSRLILTRRRREPHNPPPERKLKGAGKRLPPGCPPRPAHPYPLRQPRPRDVLHPHHEFHLFRAEARTSSPASIRYLSHLTRSCALKKATIDVCQIYGPNTVFLQQAAHLTGGSYIFLERRDALLQYLIVCAYVFCGELS
jgi:hypothetical protein